MVQVREACLALSSKWFTWLFFCLFLSPILSPAQAEIQFTDVTKEVGIDDKEEYETNNYHSLGINWIDFNKDGWPDIFAVNGLNKVPHLYKNKGDGTFTKRDDLLPVLRNDLDMGGSVFADYDNDGDDDIFIYTDYEEFLLNGPNEFSGPPDFLLKNKWVENGGAESVPLFEEVASAAGVDDLVYSSLGLEIGHRSMAGGWLDYNLDGCIDLYVGHWVLQADSEEDGIDQQKGSIANKDRLYQNNCDGTFGDATDVAGIYPDPASVANVAHSVCTVTNAGQNVCTEVCTGINCYYRPTLAFIGAHLNSPLEDGRGDVWPDMYSVNVHDLNIFSHDLIFQNNGPQNNGDFTFTDVTNAGDDSSTAVPIVIGDDAGAGMGIDVADVDLDGDWDIYMADILESENLKAHDSAPYGNIFYINQFAQTGELKFQDNSIVESGVKADFSWSVNFFDVDQDGDEDLWVGTVDGKEKFLYRNNGVGSDGHVKFENVATATDLNDETMNLRGSATADYDGDGDMDLITIQNKGPLRLFRNDSTDTGNWIQIQLVPDPARAGTKTNRSAIGTLVKATAGSLHMMRQVKGGSSAHSQNSLVVHFGLGTATTIEELQILWPSGEIDYFCNFSVNKKLEMLEGTALNQPCSEQPPDTTAPIWPSVALLTGSILDATSVALAWVAAGDDVSVTSYVVYRDGEEIKTTVGLGMTDSLLFPKTTYCYTVQAMDGSGNRSVQSNEVCIKVESDSTSPPPPPLNLVATVVGAYEVHLSWSVPDVDVLQYNIFRNGSRSYSATPIYYDARLTPDTTYCYTVTVTNLSGNESEPSNESCATPTDLSPPGFPTDLKVKALSSTAVLLKWSVAVDDVGVTSYRIYRGGGRSVIWNSDDRASFTDNTAVPGTLYSYTVTALDAKGHESYSSASVTAETLSGLGEVVAANAPGKSGCFIATAAYGSEMESHVQLLRDFRDRYLLPFPWGKRFVATYYRYSPPVADVIRGQEGLKIFVRWLLWPLVALVWFLLKVSMGVKLLTGLLLVGAMYVRFLLSTKLLMHGLLKHNLPIGHI